MLCRSIPVSLNYNLLVFPFLWRSLVYEFYRNSCRLHFSCRERNLNRGIGCRRYRGKCSKIPECPSVLTYLHVPCRKCWIRLIIHRSTSNQNNPIKRSGSSIFPKKCHLIPPI